MWALVANCGCVFLLGCVNLGSTSAFNALVSTGLILQQVSFAFPAALVLYHRVCGTIDEAMPRSKASFKLPFGLGPVSNVLTIVFALVSLVFYDFPTVLPVTAANMSECAHKTVHRCFRVQYLRSADYASAVIGVMGVLAVLNWLGYASKRYQGPRLDEAH